MKEIRRKINKNKHLRELFNPLYISDVSSEESSIVELPSISETYSKYNVVSKGVLTQHNSSIENSNSNLQVKEGASNDLDAFFSKDAFIEYTPYASVND